MKKILFLLLIPFLFSDCKKEEPFLFEMNYRVDFTIQAGLSPFAGTHIFRIPGIPTNIAQNLQERNLSLEDIESISPKGGLLTAIFDGGEYSFIREVSVKIISSTTNSIKQEIFYHPQVPENQNGDLSLAGTLVDAIDFISEETFTIEVELMLRDISPQSIDTRFDFQFAVR